ncbi:MAG: hypothetical protein K1X83_08015 [Oligoflexia bacterium]|nr:hypothetical protein [Oligoflexia bacterium]
MVRTNARRYQTELKHLYETLHYLSDAGVYTPPSSADELQMMRLLNGEGENREEKFVELACKIANTRYIRIH